MVCWNGDIVRGAFIIDAHDREIIAQRVVVNAGFSGIELRDIILEAFESLCGAFRIPSVIEMLCNNGPPCMAMDKPIFDRQLGLKPCFTPIQSTQSNQISEVLVKTLMRDFI